MLFPQRSNLPHCNQTSSPNDMMHLILWGFEVLRTRLLHVRLCWLRIYSSRLWNPQTDEKNSSDWCILWRYDHIQCCLKWFVEITMLIWISFASILSHSLIHGSMSRSILFVLVGMSTSKSASTTGHLRVISNFCTWELQAYFNGLYQVKVDQSMWPWIMNLADVSSVWAEPRSKRRTYCLAWNQDNLREVRINGTFVN